jgi:hypothetical protein
MSSVSDPNEILRLRLFLGLGVEAVRQTAIYLRPLAGIKGGLGWSQALEKPVIRARAVS